MKKKSSRRTSTSYVLTPLPTLFFHHLLYYHTAKTLISEILWCIPNSLLNRTTLLWTLVIAPDVKRANSLTAPTSSVVLKVKFPSKTISAAPLKDVIYAITCPKCDAVYIGETKRMIAERFRQHLYDIDKTDTTNPVPKHFTTNNHTKDDIHIHITGVRKCQGDANSRRRQEQQIIFKLGTLFPHGMNIDFPAFRR